MWDRWLKGIDNGVDEEPQLMAWMQDPIEPALDLREHPGRWVAEDCWPSPRIGTRVLGLGDPGLVEPADVTSPARSRTICSAHRWSNSTSWSTIPSR